MADFKPALGKFYQQAIQEKQQQESSEQDLSIADERYLSMQSIASGGMKKVLRSRDKKTGRILAIAQLCGEPTESDQKAFIEEARLQAALDHPGIPAVYDISKNSEGMPFFTMKYIEGDTLGTIIKAMRAGDDYFCREYPLKRLLHIIKDVCEIIIYAHKRHVVHHDIKPENILIARNGRVYLCDWGIAAMRNHIDDDSFSSFEQLHLNQLKTLTMNGWVKGTPGYMSPEQAAGNTVEKSHLCDIYALGALLYSCLCYQAPIQGDTPYDIIKKTCRGEFEPPSRICDRSRIPASLEKICLKAMSLKPQNRHKDASEFLKALLKELPKKKNNPKRSSKVVLVLLLLIITALASTNIFLVLQEKESRQKLLASPRSSKAKTLYQIPVIEDIPTSPLEKIETNSKPVNTVTRPMSEKAETRLLLPGETSPKLKPHSSDESIKDNEKKSIIDNLALHSSQLLLRRFDKDVNGVLEGDEKKLAENYLLPFDLNADGELSHFEEKQFNRTVKENRQRGRFRGKRSSRGN